jgi:hypothetical protein
MKRRIKVIKLHIADLEDLLTSATDAQKHRINDELTNGRFELAQLITRSVLLRQAIEEVV